MGRKVDREEIKYLICASDQMRLDEQSGVRAVCHHTIFAKLAKLEAVGGDRYRIADARRQRRTIYFCFSGHDLTQQGA